MQPNTAGQRRHRPVARAAHALAFLVLLVVGDGCVAWTLSTGIGPGFIPFGRHPDPGSRRYRAAVALGYVADWLAVPFLVGIPMLIIDYAYLHSGEGGYAGRWQRERAEASRSLPARRRAAPRLP